MVGMENRAKNCEKICDPPPSTSVKKYATPPLGWANRVYRVYLSMMLNAGLGGGLQKGEKNWGLCFTSVTILGICLDSVGFV